jgi:hypothetical protein
MMHRAWGRRFQVQVSHVLLWKPENSYGSFGLPKERIIVPPLCCDEIGRPDGCFCDKLNVARLYDDEALHGPVEQTHTMIRTIRPISLALLIGTSPFAFSADDQAKQETKAEERMKEEKKRDEQSAKDYANRVKVARFDSVWRAPRAVDIEVFQAREVASKPYKTIALFTFDGASKEETQAVAGFIVKAKDLGADAVLILGFEVPSIQRVDIFSPDERRVFRANAIIYQTAK